MYRHEKKNLIKISRKPNSIPDYPGHVRSDFSGINTNIFPSLVPKLNTNITSSDLFPAHSPVLKKRAQMGNGKLKTFVHWKLLQFASGNFFQSRIKFVVLTLGI